MTIEVDAFELVKCPEEIELRDIVDDTYLCGVLEESLWN